jgi:hypothetical protein
MEKNQKKEVVNSVTTVKKKYVKPDFEVYELNWEAPLLMGSGDANGLFGIQQGQRHTL